jgi:hypothetical protein
MVVLAASILGAAVLAIWIVTSPGQVRPPSKGQAIHGSTDVGSSSANARGGSSTSLVPRTQSSSTTPPTSDSVFDGAISTYLAQRTGSFTAALYNVKTGQIFEFHPGVAQDEASIVKVDIMATVFSQEPEAPSAIPASEQQLLTTMIEESDNDSATTLWDEVGGPNAINAVNQRIGLSGTTPSQCVTCPGFPWPGWGLTTTTALDQVDLLRQFVSPSSLITDAQRNYGLGLMESIDAGENWGVTGGVPSGVTVALKNGWLPLSGESDWQVNSMGWVNGDGRDYVLAVLTTGNPTEQYGIDTIDEVSSVLWNELG